MIYGYAIDISVDSDDGEGSVDDKYGDKLKYPFPLQVRLLWLRLLITNQHQTGLSFT